jgi:hypothetical protein
MNTKKNLAGLMVSVVLVWVASATATVHTDDFTYPDGSLSAQTDWERRGDKTEWLVATNEIVPEGVGTGGVSAVWYSGAVHSGEIYQRVAVDLEFNASFVSGASGWFLLSLNQNVANSGDFANEQAYSIQLRSGDFLVTKQTNEGIHNSGSDWKLYPTPLVAGTTYRIQLERICDEIVGTIFEGANVIAQDQFTDTGVQLVGGRAGLTGFYQDSVNDYVVDNFEFELDNTPRVIPPVVISDSFTYPNGGLSAVNPADWQRRGDKTEWQVVNNAITTPAGQNGNWAKFSAAGAESTFQKTSLDFVITDENINAFSAGWCMLTLNQDWGNSGFYMNEQAYTFLIRAREDMFIGREEGAGHPNTWGWEGNAANPQYSLTGLSANVTYRAELEKNGSVLTGTILEGATIIAQVSFDESTHPTLTGPRTGGLAGIVNHNQDNNDFHQLDNYEYKYGESRICGPGACGDAGTLFLQADINRDCYVDIGDLREEAEQWLFSSDPQSPQFVTPSAPTALSFRLPRDTSIVVDGDLSDWPAGAEWYSLDKLYHIESGEPNDLDTSNSRFSARWDDVKDSVYVAVEVVESVQFFESDHIGPVNQDSIEIYSQGSGAGGTGWSGEFDVAQQYRLGPATNSPGTGNWNGNWWCVWGTDSLLQEQIPDPNLGFVCSVDVTGNKTTYEIEVPQYDSYEGLSGSGTRVRSDLQVGDVIGFDVVAITVKNIGTDVGAWANNQTTGKFNDAGQFADFTLSCSEGSWPADLSGDCDVNFIDHALLESQWGECTDPNNPTCF